MIGPWLLTLAIAAAAGAQPAYVAGAHIALGAGERWDYLTYDPVDARVYVAHGNHITVVDAAKHAIVGEVGPIPGGTHGIVIVRVAGRGYTDDGTAGEAIAFDLKTLEIVKRIPADKDADGMVFDRRTGRVFVINADSGTITVIDPKRNIATKTIRVGAGLEAGVSDDAGRLYVDGVEKNDLVVIDTKSKKVVAHYPLEGCERPHGIAIDTRAHRVFATCINKVMVVVDTDTGRNVAKLPIGGGSDGAVYDAKRGLVVSANGEGTLSVYRAVDPDHYEALPDVATTQGARTIALDASTGRLFLPGATVAGVDPPATADGRPRTRYEAGSLKLLEFTPR